MSRQSLTPSSTFFPLVLAQSLAYSAGMDKANEQVQEQDREYERPNVVDYGTLVELTAAGSYPHHDIPNGTPAFS